MITTRVRTGWWVLLPLLVLAGAFFVVRGPWRAVGQSADYAMVYTAARVWVTGGDPYDNTLLRQTYGDLGGPVDQLSDRDVAFTALYPPATMVIFAPLAGTDWPTARWQWAAANLAWWAVLFVAVLRLAGGEGASGPGSLLGLGPRPLKRGGRGLLPGVLLGVFLLFGPVHTNLGLGQIGLFAVALTGVGLVAMGQGRAVVAGLLLGVATATKPQLVGLVLVGMALMGRWRVFAAGCVTGGLVLGVGVLRLELAGVDWLSGMRANQQAFAASNLVSTAGDNPMRYLLMNLPLLIRAVVDHEALALAVSWAAVVLGVGLGVWWERGRLAGEVAESVPRALSGGGELPGPLPGAGVDRLLLPSVLLALALLPVYHRFYDAVVLLLPAAWVVLGWRGRGDGARWLVGAGLLVFMVPNIQAGLHAVVQPRLPAVVSGSVFWRAGPMVLTVWAILLILVGLLWALWRSKRRALAAA